jgi:hypothetical protein
MSQVPRKSSPECRLGWVNVVAVEECSAAWTKLVDMSHLRGDASEVAIQVGVPPLWRSDHRCRALFESSLLKRWFVTLAPTDEDFRGVIGIP